MFLVPDLDALRAAAEQATPGDLDTAEHTTTAWFSCPCCDGEGQVQGKTSTNFDGFALGVQFFGVGNEFESYETYFRLAKPTSIIALIDTHKELLAKLKAAEAENERLVRAWNAKHDSQVKSEAEAKKWFDLFHRQSPTPAEAAGQAIETAYPFGYRSEDKEP